MHSKQQKTSLLQLIHIAVKTDCSLGATQNGAHLVFLFYWMEMSVTAQAWTMLPSAPKWLSLPKTRRLNFSYGAILEV